MRTRVAVVLARRETRPLARARLQLDVVDDLHRRGLAQRLAELVEEDGEARGQLELGRRRGVAAGDPKPRSGQDLLAMCSHEIAKHGVRP